MEEAHQLAISKPKLNDDKVFEAEEVMKDIEKQ